MERDNNQLKVRMHLDNEYLTIGEEATLTITVENIGNEKIENGLFRLLLDDTYIKILEEKFNVCVRNFASIGSLNPKQNITISIPIQITSSPKDKTLCVSCFINYHIIRNDNIYDQNYESDIYNIKLYDVNILTRNDFKVNSYKDEYLIDEDIYCYITLSNTGNSLLENINIKNFISQNTVLVESSILCDDLLSIDICNEELIVKRLPPGETYIIKYKLNIPDCVSVDEIVLEPSLSYLCDDIKPVNIISNAINIKIKQKNFFEEDSFIHSINKSNIYNEESIEHTIYIKNNTDTYISSLSLIENLPPELDFIENSLVVGCINRVSESIYEPIKLGDLEPGEDILIKYKTSVFGEFKNIEFNSILNYDTNRRNITQDSNNVCATIIGTIFSSDNFTKSISTNNISIGDTITCTINITNTGNISATNVIIKDILPKHMKFVDESIIINDILRKECHIEKGIFVGSINPNEKINICYKSIAMGICTNEKTSAQIFYKYDGVDNILTINSNSVAITVSGAKIGENNFLKQTNTTSCQIGDILTTRLTVENTGNIHCESLKIMDCINSSLEFIEGSLRIDGKSSDDLDIFEGINIANLKTGEMFSITYQVKILDYPKPNPIDDRATLVYSYIKDGSIRTKEIRSTRNKIYINNPLLRIVDINSTNHHGSFIKYINYNDYTFFTFCIENLGNVALENLNLKFIMPDEIKIEQNSIKLNNLYLNKDIKEGITIPNLNVSQKIYLDFAAQHIYGDQPQLESHIYADYSFKDIQHKNIIKKNLKFHEKILVAKPDLEINKFISDDDINVDKEFTQNINIKNVGNVILENITVDLNEDIFLNQCDNTLLINGNFFSSNEDIFIDKLDINETINIALRYKLNCLPSSNISLKESIIKAEYKFDINQNPISITRKSNLLKLDIKNYNLQIEGKCISNIITLNEVYNYTFIITNTGNVPCDNAILTLPSNKEIELLKNSFTINGRKIFDINTVYGLDIGFINYNESVAVSFDFKVVSLPYQNKINFDAGINAMYTHKNEILSKVFDYNSSELNIESVSLDLIKSVSHDYLQTGDILKIHTIIQNNGSTNISDLILTDNKDVNLTFIENSLCIDGKYIANMSPLDGVKISSLSPDESIIIVYEYEYIPRVSNSRITHFSEANFTSSFKADRKKIYSVKSNIFHIEGALSTFKQFSIEKEHILKSYDPSIKEILSVIADAKVEDFYEIDSIKNRSFDRVTSTGKKAIIKGSISSRIEYITSDDNSALYMISNKEPFTVFINLPEDSSNDDLYFRAKCDDTFFKSIDNRTIFVSNLISIEGTM